VEKFTDGLLKPRDVCSVLEKIIGRNRAARYTIARLCIYCTRHTFPFLASDQCVVDMMPRSSLARRRCRASRGLTDPVGESKEARRPAFWRGSDGRVSNRRDFCDNRMTSP
jgi:hypothetical protein